MFFSFREWITLFIFSLISTIFSLCISLATGFIVFKKNTPRIIFFLAIAIQVGLSIGCFIGVLLWYKTSFVPKNFPRDFFTGIFLAYIGALTPQITIAIFLIGIKGIGESIKKFFNIQSMPMQELKFKNFIDIYHESVKNEEVNVREELENE